MIYLCVSNEIIVRVFWVHCKAKWIHEIGYGKIIIERRVSRTHSRNVSEIFFF